MMFRKPPRRGFGAALALVLMAPLAFSPGAALAADEVLVDDFESELVQGQVGGVPVGYYQATDPKTTYSYAATTDLPAPVPGSEAGNQALRTTGEVDSFGVVVSAFTNEAADAWLTQDWSPYEGMQFWFHGTGSGTTMFVDVIDNRPADSTTDNAERFSASFVDDQAGWRLVQLPFAEMNRKDIGNGAPNDGFTLTRVHGWAFGNLRTDGTEEFYIDDVALYGTAPERPLTVGFGAIQTAVVEGETAQVSVQLSKTSEQPVTVTVRSTIASDSTVTDIDPVLEQVTIDPGDTTATISIPTADNTKWQGERSYVLELHDVSGAELGRPPVSQLLVTDDEERDPWLVEDVEREPYAWEGNGATTVARTVVSGTEQGPGSLEPEGALELTAKGKKAQAERIFPIEQDWSSQNTLELWYRGEGTGKKVQVGLANADGAVYTGDPATWELAWSDEFDGPAGAAPNPEHWTPELGDGTVNGIPGWGNDELQYYTDDPDNVALDGEGNLAITVREVEGSDADGPLCYYGPCDYTSARLLTQHKEEFAYGRLEARIQAPGGAGLWPAFWSLGTDIPYNPWPQAGEIDIMEFVGKEPTTVFGTIHGPGYAGGQSYGDDYDFGEPVPGVFHTYRVDWSPDHIVWAVDDIEFHDARPADVAPNEWVFNHPFFLLLNTAIGGNFGGPVGEDTVFPQQMLIDYVRVYQAPVQQVWSTVSFVDDTAGWRQVSIPLADFAGLDTSAVTGIQVKAPLTKGGSVLVDQVRVTEVLPPCVEEYAVTSVADSGEGSLRRGLLRTCEGGTLVVDAALAGQTVALASPLAPEQDVVIDGGDLVLDGQGTGRVLEVPAGVQVQLTDATLRGGYGYELAGAVLNNGDLALERVVVEDNLVTTSGVDFWKGGAGIYTGDGGSLALLDSTVRNNTVEGGPGGGLWSGFGSTTTIERSTLSGNTASDVGGGARLLGESTVLNSTVSGNTATGWHGGGLFQTDGAMTMDATTVTDNTSPGGTAGGLFVGTFGDAAASVSYANSIIAGNTGDQCFVAYFGAGAVALTSRGHNLVGDASCQPVATDIVAADPLLGALGDNGGPTQTHLPAAGSPVIDAADPATAPSLDQRGQARPAGGGPDIGAVEAS